MYAGELPQGEGAYDGIYRKWDKSFHAYRNKVTLAACCFHAKNQKMADYMNCVRSLPEERPTNNEERLLP